MNDSATTKDDAALAAVYGSAEPVQVNRVWHQFSDGSFRSCDGWIVEISRSKIFGCKGKHLWIARHKMGGGLLNKRQDRHNYGEFAKYKNAKIAMAQVEVTNPFRQNSIIE